MGQKIKSEKFKKENDFFINKKTHKIQYNKKCLTCVCNCKQSFKTTITFCPYYTPLPKGDNYGQI